MTKLAIIPAIEKEIYLSPMKSENNKAKKLLLPEQKTIIFVSSIIKPPVCYFLCKYHTEKIQGDSFRRNQGHNKHLYLLIFLKRKDKKGTKGMS